MSNGSGGERGGGGPWLPVLESARRPPDCDDGPVQKSREPPSLTARMRSAPRGTADDATQANELADPFSLPQRRQSCNNDLSAGGDGFFMVGRSFVLNDLDLSSAELNFYGRQNSEV